MKYFFAILLLSVFSTAAFAANKADVESVFAWAESKYPALFAPLGQSSQSALGYYYRYYPDKNSYLGFRDDDQNIYYLLPNSAISSAGNINQYISQAMIPPSDEEALHVYLRSGAYKNWLSEPEIHQGSSAHGRVKIFFNAALVDTLTRKSTQHNQGAASVKELYSTNNTLTGWAVSVKTQPESANGNGWYWYEVFSVAPGSKAASAGNGHPTCTGCHGQGQDYIRATLPSR